jgi:hypothetical protein
VTVLAISANGATATLPTGAKAVLWPGVPVIVMIHGYRYSPDDPRNDPHSEILAAHPLRRNARIVSWPRRLGYGRGAPGVAIGFGWDAGGTLWQAHDRAGQAGRALAGLIAELRGLGAGPVSIIAHSLGARVAMSALQYLAPGDAGRIVLLAGAEFRDAARRALLTPAGRMAEVLNVTSRENALFDIGFRVLMAGANRSAGPALGAGLALSNCVTLRIDDAPHRDGLRRLGFPVAAKARAVCHWSAYTRPGVFRVYRAFLHRPDDLTLAGLRAQLPVETPPMLAAWPVHLRPA